MLVLSEGRVIGGRYRLSRLLATGGMGVVWVARHLQLDVEVAIKFMDPSCLDNAAARARFEREAKAAAQLRTSHVVHVLDHGVDAGLPYIVMELLIGEDLGERLKREIRLPVGDAAHVITQAAKGLERAHAAGIVHRDLKPANIFLARMDDAVTVKLLDFGIAKSDKGRRLDPSETTQTGDLLGSPYYMSPEQAVGRREVDHRSDLWALAAILFRLITGRHPFPGEASGDVIVKICTGEVPLPSKVCPDLPRALDRFFVKAFARDPAKRFQSAREFARAFSAVSGEPLAVSQSFLGPDSAALAVLPTDLDEPSQAGGMGDDESPPHPGSRIGAGIVAGLGLILGGLLTFHVMSPVPTPPAAAATSEPGASDEPAAVDEGSSAETGQAAVAVEDGSEADDRGAEGVEGVEGVETARAADPAADASVDAAEASAPNGSASASSAPPRPSPRRRAPRGKNAGCVWGYEPACKR